jgi:amino acid adenylation domain-containing protein
MSNQDPALLRRLASLSPAKRDLLQSLLRKGGETPGVPANTPDATEAPDAPRAAFLVPMAAVRRAEDLARESGRGVSDVLLAAFVLLVHRQTGRTSVAVALPGGEGLESLRSEHRADAGGDPSFRRFVEEIRRAERKARLPFDRLAPALAAQASKSFVQAGFAFGAAPADLAALDLALEIAPGEGGIAGTFLSGGGKHDATTLALLAARFETLLAAALENPGLPLSELPWLPEAERRPILLEWGYGGEPSPARTLAEAVAARAAAAPEALALVGDAESLTYGELDRRSAALARALRGQGVGPERLVGLCAERRPSWIVGLLGIQRAGGAYLPLDPSYPAERLTWMIEDSGIALIVGDADLLARLPRHAAQTLATDAAVLQDSQGSGGQPLPAVSPDSLAYVIYTSGSTGRPKGVLVSHLGVGRLGESQRAILDIRPGDRLLQVGSPSFDASVGDMASTLTAGGELHLTEAAHVAADLAGVLSRRRITHVVMPPSVLATLPEKTALPDLRLVAVGGEACPPELARRWSAGRRFLNVYGPTEATVDTTAAAATPEGLAAGRMPIGRPLPGLAIRLLDRWGGPAPAGAPGHLCIGGPALARGYLNRPDLTAERFVPDPYASVSPEGAGARLYRTGDLARWLPDGKIDFLGRIDHQVKIRGHRIEPEEIEAVLAGHPEVRAVAVGPRPAPPASGGAAAVPGNQRLAAYVVLRREADAATARGRMRDLLRDFLRERLPDPLIPSLWFFLAELPLNPSGKADRKALAALQPAAAERGRSAAYVAPRNPVEELLLGIWNEVLGEGRGEEDGGERSERIGVHDNFFNLGGHSLLVTRLAARAQSVFGIEAPVRLFFENPTIAGAAAAIAALREQERPAPARAVPALRPVPRDGFLPLSFPQQRLWFIDRLAPGGTAYSIPLAVRLTGPLHGPAFRRALREIVHRHEVLRTTFRLTAAGARQVIHPIDVFLLPSVDLTGLPAAAREAELRRLAEEEARRPFDLEDGPLFRPVWLDLGMDDSALLASQHHIVSDAWSTEIFLHELGVLYAAFAGGRPSPLAPLPIQYADFAAWQRSWLTGETLAAEVEHWRQRLAGAPPILPLPADRPRPARWSGRGGSLPFVLPAALSARLLDLAHGAALTPFMLLLGAFQGLLARLCGRLDVSVGTGVAGRNRLETEGLIGFFLNTLVLRLDLRDAPQGDPDLAALLARAREVFLDALAHGDLPFEKLVEELDPDRSLSHAPLFQVMFTYQADAAPTVAATGGAGGPAGAGGGSLLRGVNVTPIHTPGDEVKYDLGLTIGEEGDRFAGAFSYSSDLFDRTTVERLAGWLEVWLDGLADLGREPGHRLSEVPLLAGPERHQVLREWNDTAAAPPPASTVHGLFERQTAAGPGRPALLFEGRSWTYGELERWSAAIARRLRQAGARPGERVAVWAERGPALAALLLGVLRSGAAYVALDPTQPAARRAAVLADSGARLLAAARRPEEGRLPEEIRTFVCLEAEGLADGPPDSFVSAPEDDPAGPLDAAYAVYTSGSTGLPKGILARHADAAAYLDWVVREYGMGEGDVALQLAAPTFDASVRDHFAPLAAGARLVLVPKDVARDPEALLDRIEAAGVTCLPSVVPSMLRLLSEAGIRRGAGSVPGGRLRLILAAGERLYAADAAAARAAFGPQVRLYNQYGASECTMSSTFHLAAPEPEGPQGTTPVGRPIAGERAIVLDRWGRPAPIGVPGEVAIGGRGVSFGYLGQPERTAEAFVPDPLADRLDEPGARLYRTGDFGRQRPDGALEYLGRLDHQVKVRGIRVEPGEVEAVLGSHPAVRQAAVLAREVPTSDGTGDVRLVAYLVLEGGPAEGTEGDPAALRAHAAARLPEALVPAVFVPLPALPLTAHGKVDREALARLELPAGGRWGLSAYVAPRTPVEQVLAGIWAEVLGLDPETGQVGAGDTFFELSGHSLLATQAVYRVRQALGVDLPLRRLFECATLAELAAEIEAGARPAPPPVPLVALPRDGRPLPASPFQEWALHLQGGPVGSALNLPFAFRLIGWLDAATLHRTLLEIVRRQELLRSTFHFAADRSYTLEPHPVPEIPLPVVDLAALPLARRYEHAQQLADQQAWRAFDLRRLPLVDFLLLRLEEGEHGLLSTFHHTVADGWSLDVLQTEMRAIYEAFREGRPSPLPELEIQFADVAAWQRASYAAAREEQTAWWKAKLAGFPEPVGVPARRPRPDTFGPRSVSRAQVLKPDLVARLRALARSSGCSLSMALAAGIYALLYRYTGREDIILGSTFASRSRPEMARLIGLLMGYVPLRASLAGGPSFRDLLPRVRETVLDAFAHQDVSFPHMIAELFPDRKLTRTLLYRVMFNLLDFANATPAPAAEPEAILGGAGADREGLAIVPVSVVDKLAKYDLAFFCQEERGAVACSLVAAADIFDGEEVAAIAADFEEILTRAVENPDAALEALLPEPRHVP